MLSVDLLPHLNAALNATASVFLATGWVLIRSRRIAQHRAFMIAAVVTSGLFLTSYVVYHALAGSKLFPGTGWIRAVYFSILIPHTILAAFVLPMVLVTFVRGLRRQDARHRRLARWTMPLWLFVSVSGVVVYLMLYHGVAG
jgi:putative membrane protein